MRKVAGPGDWRFGDHSRTGHAGPDTSEHA